MTLSRPALVYDWWAANPIQNVETDETHSTNMMRYNSDYDDPDYDDVDDYSLLEDDDEDVDDLGLLDEAESSLEDDDIEISMEVDADGNEIY